MTSAVPSGRVTGTFSTLYKQALLAKMLSRMAEDPSPMGYYNFFGGCPSYLIPQTLENFPAAHLHRWLTRPLAERSVPKEIESIKPYLTRLRDTNLATPLDRFGFANPLYLPGDTAIVTSFMRPGDRAYLFEGRPNQVALLKAAYEKDERVRVLFDDVNDPKVLKHMMPPLNKRAIVHFDLGDSPTYSEQLQVRVSPPPIPRYASAFSFCSPLLVSPPILHPLSSTRPSHRRRTSCWAPSSAFPRAPTSFRTPSRRASFPGRSSAPSPPPASATPTTSPCLPTTTSSSPSAAR